MKRFVFLMTALICLSPAFSADISKIKFEYLTVDNGLSQGIVEDILQDKQGYTFLLKGSNSDSVWNDVARNIVIQITPPWYKTKLVIMVFLLAVVLFIVYYIREKEKQSVHDKMILEQKIQKAESDLKGKTQKLEEQQEEIRRRDLEEKDLRFYTDGIARMSDIMAKKRHNLEELSTSTISELVRYINASAGGIFVIDDSDPQHIVLRASGEFCISSDKAIHYAFEAGEGNVGTCFVEKKTLKIDNIPDGYIVLRSGLGSVSLHHAMYIPILQDNSCVGVIEIASDQKLPDNKITFVEKIVESLASIITIIKANEKTSHMLERNNSQAEEFRAQEEEMRQNLEEMMATQAESQRKEKQLLADVALKTKTIKKLQKELAKYKS